MTAAYKGVVSHCILIIHLDVSLPGDDAVMMVASELAERGATMDELN